MSVCYAQIRIGTQSKSARQSTQEHTMNEFSRHRIHESNGMHTAAIRRVRHHTLLSVSAFVVSLAAALATSENISARAILNTCSGSVDAVFKNKCESHANYQAVNLRLSGDGGCMEMCCKGHPDTGYTCTSDPGMIVDRLGGGTRTPDPATSVTSTPTRPPKTIFISPTQPLGASKK
jgi:hypothetical protein